MDHGQCNNFIFNKMQKKSDMTLDKIQSSNNIPVNYHLKQAPCKGLEAEAGLCISKMCCSLELSTARCNTFYSQKNQEPSATEIDTVFQGFPSWEFRRGVNTCLRI